MAVILPASRFSFDAAAGRLIETTATGTLTIFAWPAVKAFRWSAATCKSTSDRPEIALLTETLAEGTYRFDQVPELDAHAQACLELFCDRVPQRVRRVVAWMPERQWEVLAWVARVGLTAEDLLTSNPALAFAVANLPAIAGDAIPSRSLETQQLLLPNRRQRDILDRLGFPPSERARRILRKVLPRSICVQTLTQLREHIPRPAIAERLAHVPAIGPNILALLDNDTFERISLTALDSFARADETNAMSDIAARLAHAARIWNSERAAPAITIALQAPTRRRRQRPRPRRTIRHYAPLVPPTIKPDYPPPPIPGNFAIVPLTYREDLVEEARQQANCVIDYEYRVLNGRMAIYRVLFPERCTLSLKLRRGKWIVDQLRAARNREPGGAVVQAVNAWLAAAENSFRPWR